VDVSGVEFDEEQHLWPSQPDGVDVKQVAGDEAGGLLAQEWSPGGGGPPWAGSSP
jgi:hypothetical protein